MDFNDYISEPVSKHNIYSQQIENGNYFIRSDSDNILVRSLSRKINKITQKYHNFILFLQFIYLNTFLLSQTFQLSPLIKYGTHARVTNYNYAYDLTLVIMITYSLLCISNITKKYQTRISNENRIEYNYILSRSELLVYQFITGISAIFFAVLGQVPFLQNFTISGDFLKHLTFKEVIVFIVIGAPLLYYTIKDLCYLIKYRKIQKTLISYLVLITVFLYNYITLFSLKSKNIHYHIHHAIFSGLMSLLYNDWSDKYAIIMHGIYMGVLVEGISFYGMSELYIFMVDNSTVSGAIPSLIVTILSIGGWTFYTCKYYKPSFFIHY